uniref:Uncharacterized protein n=1 Tax=Arundo donax TaxID=35708 RepID=A0A0A8Y9I7_ARUDO
MLIFTRSLSIKSSGYFQFVQAHAFSSSITYRGLFIYTQCLT